MAGRAGGWVDGGIDGGSQREGRGGSSAPELIALGSSRILVFDLPFWAEAALAWTDWQSDSGSWSCSGGGCMGQGRQAGRRMLPAGLLSCHNMVQSPLDTFCGEVVVSGERQDGLPYRAMAFISTRRAVRACRYHTTHAGSLAWYAMVHICICPGTPADLSAQLSVRFLSRRATTGAWVC